MMSLQSAVRPLICHACGRTTPVPRNLLNGQPRFRTTAAIAYRASSSSAAEVVVDNVTDEPVASSSRSPRGRRGLKIAKAGDPRQRPPRATAATSISDGFSAAPLPVWKRTAPYRRKRQQRLSAGSVDPTGAVKSFADGRLDIQHYLDDGTSVPLDVMLELLRLPATASQLAEIFPICLQHTFSESRRQVLLEMVAACISNHNFVLLPATVSAVLASIDEGHGKHLLDDYRSLLNIVMVKRGVGKQADRVVLRLISVLEADPTIDVPPDLVDELLTKTLTLATATRLLEFINNRGLTIEEHFWRRAASLAFDAGQVAVANTFVAKAADKLAEDEESTKPHPIHHLMSAQVIPYGEALEVLRPFLKITKTPEEIDTPSTFADEGAAVAVQLGTPAKQDDENNPDLPAITELSPEWQWGSNAVFDIDDTHHLTQRAWTMLFNCAGPDRSVKYYDVVAMTKVIPEEAVHAATYTAAMTALLRKNAHGPARDLWAELSKLHMAAHPSVRWKLVDASALAVAAEALYRQRRRHRKSEDRHREPLKDVIRLVDEYAARGGILSLALGLHKTPPKVVGTTVRGSVVLNASIVNRLLHMCARSRTPSMAFRIWAAARPRWNVLPDDVSLALLLDAAGRAPEHGNSHREEHEGEDVFRHRMRSLAKSFHLPVSKMSLTPPLEQPDQYWLTAPQSAFHDPINYRWWMEHARGPWDEARDLFKTIMLSNYPDLASVISPISYQRDLISEFRAFVAPPRLAAEPGTPAPMGGPHAYLLPGPAAFNSYITLLAQHFAGPYAGVDGDVGQPLAWMRALKIVPLRYTLLTALTSVSDNEGPRRRVRIGSETRLARDEEILRAYLVEWLGDGVNAKGQSVVPTEEDVAAYHRAKQVRWLSRKMRKDREREERMAAKDRRR